MKKIFVVSIIFLGLFLTMQSALSTQFNLPICWVTNSVGVSIDANCDGILDASNVNLSNYYNQSESTSLFYLNSNPKNYLNSTSASLLYYPLSSNPSGYLTSASVNLTNYYNKTEVDALITAVNITTYITNNITNNNTYYVNTTNNFTTTYNDTNLSNRIDSLNLTKIDQTYGNATYYLASNPLNFINSSATYNGDETYIYELADTFYLNISLLNSYFNYTSIINSIGNWTLDKVNYVTNTVLNSNISVLNSLISGKVSNATLSNYYNKTEIDASQTAQNTTINTKIDQTYANATYLKLSNYQGHNQNLNMTSDVIFNSLNIIGNTVTALIQTWNGGDIDQWSSLYLGSNNNMDISIGVNSGLIETKDIHSNDWSNVSITTSQISDYSPSSGNNNYTSGIGFNNSGGIYQLNTAVIGRSNLTALFDVSAFNDSALVYSQVSQRVINATLNSYLLISSQNYTSNIGWTNGGDTKTLNLARIGMSNLTASLDLSGKLNVTDFTNSQSTQNNTIISLSGRVDVVNSTLQGLVSYNTTIVGRLDAINSTVSTHTSQISGIQANITNVNATVNSKAGVGNCPTGQVVQNTTTSGVQCVSASSGSANISGTLTTGSLVMATGTNTIGDASGDVTLGNSSGTIVFSINATTQTVSVNNGYSFLVNNVNLTQSITSVNNSALKNLSNAVFTTIGVTSAPAICSVVDTFVQYWNGTNSVCTELSSAYVTQTYGNATYVKITDFTNSQSAQNTTINTKIDQTYGNATYYLASNQKNYLNDTSVNNATILRTFTSFAGGDITSGSYNSLVITDDSHAHTKSTVTISGENITAGTIAFAYLPSLTNTHTHSISNLTNGGSLGIVLNLNTTATTISSNTTCIKFTTPTMNVTIGC